MVWSLFDPFLLCIKVWFVDKLLKFFLSCQIINSSLYTIVRLLEHTSFENQKIGLPSKIWSKFWKTWSGKGVFEDILEFTK